MNSKKKRMSLKRWNEGNLSYPKQQVLSKMNQLKTFQLQMKSSRISSLRSKRKNKRKSLLSNFH